MYKVGSLFSGCGGLDLGFLGDFTFLGKEYEKRLFDITIANDLYSQAANTYRSNIGDHIVERYIEDLLINDIDTLPIDADLVIGGFPCQDFSVAGKRQGLIVKRGKLYLQMKKVIEQIDPKYLLLKM